MSWTPAASHLMKQRPRKRGPRHEGSESTKWKEEISYPDSETLMSIYVCFRCFILLLWFMEIHYLDVTRGCVLAVLGYTYLNNMCIHMDNFLYGVLQSIADYGIETWKISLLAFYRYCYLFFLTFCRIWIVILIWLNIQVWLHAWWPREPTRDKWLF